MKCPECNRTIDDTDLPWDFQDEEVECACGHTFVVRAEYKFVRHVLICSTCGEANDLCFCDDEEEQKGGAA